MTWFTIVMALVLSIVNGWSKIQVYFVLDFNQDNLKFDMYMEISWGIKTKIGIRTTYFLNLLNNIYRQRQGSSVWNQYLTKVL